MFYYFVARPFLAKLGYKSTTKKSDKQTLLYNNNKKTQPKATFQRKTPFYLHK